ncbi:MAG: DUF6496 domain-containing protein [Chitinophagaceae bacterium]
MAKYSKGAQKKVEKVMHEKKKGTLRSGSGKKVTSRKQAIAIGLSEARKQGAKVPAKKKTAAKKGAAKKGAVKKKAAKKGTAKKRTAPKKRAAKKTARKK